MEAVAAIPRTKLQRPFLILERTAVTHSHLLSNGVRAAAPSVWLVSTFMETMARQHVFFCSNLFKIQDFNDGLETKCALIG